MASLQNKDNDVVLQISKMESRLKNLKGRPTWSPGLLSPLVLGICCSLCLNALPPDLCRAQALSPSGLCPNVQKTHLERSSSNTLPKTALPAPPPSLFSSLTCFVLPCGAYHLCHIAYQLLCLLPVFSYYILSFMKIGICLFCSCCISSV